MNVGVVIAAAGSGKRMGTKVKKQFLPLGDKPILIHTLECFLSHSQIKEWVVVTGEDDVQATKQLVRSYSHLPAVKVIAGGAERQESVYRGLQSLQHSDYVLIHDGARPFVSPDLLERLFNELKRTDAVIPGVPVKDTIKQVNQQGQVMTTPPRDSLWAVQTPQAFRLSRIIASHEVGIRNQWAVTDDAMLMEKLGVATHVTLGDRENLKITTPEDMVFAKAILEERKKRT